MSYRLRKLWDKDPVAAAKESTFYVVILVLMVLFVLSDCFKVFPPAWQIIVVLLVAGLLIWSAFYYAKVLQKK